MADMGKESVAKTKNEEYLGKVFSIFKKTEGMAFTKIRSQFNNSEMRLLGEVIMANYEGKRIISTQLAKRLGITRSAVSQMVNKLEARGVVRRVADEIDRKIAYIELSEKAEEAYRKEKEHYCEFIGEVVERFGEEKLDELFRLYNEFFAVLTEMKK
ncbi:MAG: MarR family transcriptional regulator [Clostridia bacterium]|nr:MarR family transcriptional regulator [Clostridia bacterium]